MYCSGIELGELHLNAANVVARSDCNIGVKFLSSRERILLNLLNLLVNILANCLLVVL